MWWVCVCASERCVLCAVCMTAITATLLLDPLMSVLPVKGKRLLAVALSANTNCENMAP